MVPSSFSEHAQLYCGFKMANSSGNAQENSTLKRPWVSCHAYHDQDCVPDKQVDPVVTSPLPKKTRSVPDLEQLSENRAVESEPLQVQALANRSDRPAVSGTGAPASGIDDGEKKVLTSIIERSGKTDTTQAFVNDGYQDKEPPDSNEEPEPSPEDVAEDIRFVVGEVDTVDDVDEQEADNVSEISGLSGLSIEGSGWRPMAGPLSWVQNQMKRGADPRRLLRQLIPNDMMLPSDLDNLMLWKIIINILSEPPKRKKLPDFQTIADVVDLIQKCSNILVLTGAGVSVSCGIPDFRSRDGIYARLAEEYPDLPDPQAMFDIHYFRRNPKPFFKFAKEIYPGQFEPSRSHRFIRLIEEHRKLLRNYTQNIDTLEQVAGINNVIQCHGSFATATCMVCRFREDAEAIRQDVMNQVVPRCPCCPDEESLAIMKPDIVFFGEGLPEEFHNQMEQDKDQCDLLIVIGSSLKVRPVALIPNSLPPNVPQILINREPLKHLNFDVELLGDCDIIVNELCHRLADSWSSCCRTGLPAVEISREDMVTPVGSLQGSSMGDTPMPASEENSCSSFQLASVTDRHTPVTQEDSDSGVVTTTSSSHTPSRQLQHDDGRGQSASRTSDSVVSSSGLSQSDSSSRLSFDDLEGTSKEVSKYPASAIGGAMLSSCTSASEDRQLLSTCSDDAAASTSELNGAVLASSSSSVLVDGELHCTSSGHTSASRFTLSGTLPTSTVVDEQDMHTVNTAPAATSMHGAETPPSAGADKTEHPVNTVLAATSSSECDSSSKEKPSMDEGATTPPTYSNVESTVSSTDNDLKELRACWQPKLVNLASRLKEDTFLFLPPSRYVFMGAEVYEGNEESDDDDDDDEGQDNTSTFSSNLSVDYDDVDDAPMDSPSGSSIADASPTEEDSHQDQAVFAAEADAAASDSAEVLTAAEPCTDVTSSSCRSITHSLDTDKPVNSGSSAGGLGPGPEPGPASQEV